MHLDKISTRSNLKWPPIGHYSLPHGRYQVNRCRLLDHYYKTKYEFSGEDAPWISIVSDSKWPTIGIIYLVGLISGKPCQIARPLLYKTKCDVSGADASWKISTRSNSKWPPIAHYLLSLAQYLANRVRWLDRYYKTECDVSREDAPWIFLSRLKFQLIGHYLLSHAQYFANCVRWLDHYYKTKSEVSGGGCNLANFNQIKFKMTVNQPLFTSIGLISDKPCQIGRPLLEDWLRLRFAISDWLSSSYLTLKLSLLNLVILRLDFWPSLGLH